MKEELDLDSAIRWVTESGVQNANGGFYAWYDCEKKRYSFLYPEITGYAIQFLVELYRLTEKTAFLLRANAAADWLLSVQKEDGAFHCRYYDETGRIDRCSYVFDAGICLSGLLSLFEATSNEKLLKSSLGIADWLLKSQNPDGSFVAAYDANYVVIDSSHWSSTRGCHHLKNLLALKRLLETLEDKRYFDSAEKLLKWGLDLQQDSGRFCMSYALEETYTHSHCYAVEGLLKATELFGKEAMRMRMPARIVRGARWLSRMQNKDGSIWNYRGSREEKTKVSDATAQALRIWILVREYFGIENEFKTNIKRGLSFLRKMQCQSEDASSFGGIYYGERNGKTIKHINTCATLFTVQAVSFLKEHGANPSLLGALF